MRYRDGGVMDIHIDGGPRKVKTKKPKPQQAAVVRFERKTMNRSTERLVTSVPRQPPFDVQA